MALGKRRDEQEELFVATAKIAQGPGHPFYAKLNEVLRLGGATLSSRNSAPPSARKAAGRASLPAFISGCS